MSSLCVNKKHPTPTKKYAHIRGIFGGFFIGDSSFSKCTANNKDHTMPNYMFSSYI